MRYIDRKNLLSKHRRWGNPADKWRDRTLREDFEAHFFGKCWYTEADIAGSDAHIDHFRPKDEVKQFQNYDYNVPIATTGYNWLRNDVKNYRVSCTFANRITGQGTNQGGKGAYFPLRHGSPRMTPGGNEKERHLLIDPCKKNDVKLISFFGKDVICASNKARDIERVTVSKVIYNLIDPDIENRRSRVWEDVSKTIAEFRAGEISEAACIRRLADVVSRDRPYSACAIACVNSLAPDDIKAQLDLRL